MLPLSHTHGSAPRSPYLPRKILDHSKISELEHELRNILQEKSEVEVLPVVDLSADS